MCLWCAAEYSRHMLPADNDLKNVFPGDGCQLLQKTYGQVYTLFNNRQEEARFDGTRKAIATTPE
jgi:hypothetical protein